MTKNQFYSHSEQMESVRRDFNEHWKKNILPPLEGLSERDKMAMMQIHWLEFKSHPPTR